MRQRLRTARCLCDFDSSVAAVRAVGRFLRGKDFKGLGIAPGSAWAADLIAHLPSPARRRLFMLGAHLQGAPLTQVRRVGGEDLAAWTTDQYGPGPYPATFIGSGSGAAVHLAAALHAPVLPQTYLVPVRARLDPDQPRAAMTAGLQFGRQMVAANPDLALCHMHDPVQDRAMLVRFMYFRFKRLRLGAVLERFLEQRLAPGATIFIVDCTLTWPMAVLGDRHRFQFGALGGMPPDEYAGGSDRVARHLAEQKSAVRQWDAPPPDERYPEAEWGYDDSLTADITALAARCGYRVRRITIGEPEHLSPLVADLYRWWYRRRGLPGDRLLVETYNQWEPYWALRLGAVPFWLQFTAESSLHLLERWLEQNKDPYRHIHVNLFSNGLRSVGQVPAGQWRELARRYAGAQGGLLGVDERAFPEDIGSTLRYQPALASLPERHPLPPPLGLAELDEFLAEQRHTDACRLVGIETVGTAAS
ncbi:hypothetical protein SSP24_00530 [Streptomyces spinoverrucosus]|uniref:Uncharacterized protein n=1 Tax=Streptomyces spinoverrucosus TaxID=284043 RepID=A0A4Y3V8B7_9ACTN|nr:hypothetical protein SSP24_00530 [Streptomyces spinoverrucosus]GHB43225.1 hypothetical protein GCM10010397_12060 [Streptomyces spinoverrucosus]